MLKRCCVLTVVGLLLTAMVVGCGSRKSEIPDDPRQVVISFFGAMQKDDKAALAYMLDLPELMREARSDYALQTDQPRTFTNPEQILDDLTGDGKTKERWFSMQRIINEATVEDDHALVEVTFVDKDASKGYMTMFGLHKRQEKWRIYSFNVFEESP
ncbi:hypothetical protein GF377_02340 [candidate division GN15 bacterium]|nr:hypothetical protein [candidate division GN15 bacterium]